MVRLSSTSAKPKLSPPVLPARNLITNAEWMTLARNAEAQTANWADGSIGSTVAAGGDVSGQCGQHW